MPEWLPEGFVRDPRVPGGHSDIQRMPYDLGRQESTLLLPESATTGQTEENMNKETTMTIATAERPAR